LSYANHAFCTYKTHDNKTTKGNLKSRIASEGSKSLVSTFSIRT